MEEKSILVIDVDSEFLNLIREVLTNGGYRVILASNSIELFIKLRMELFDLIIATNNMPKFGNLDMLKRYHFKFPETRIILLQDYGDCNCQEVDLPPENWTCLQKPVTMSILKNHVTRVLTQNS